MKETGGYFELELNRGSEYHQDALRLNLGRNAFEYILRTRGIKRIYLPWYICDVMIKPVQRLGIDHNFYHINERLEPVFDSRALQSDEYFLYVNYFGLKDKFIRVLTREVSNLIIDNAPAFFSEPVRGVDTFYSPRKFLGVPDGAYLYTDKKSEQEPEQDFSYKRFGHLIGRIDIGAESSFQLFRENESLLKDQPIKRMSKITHHLLGSIDYRNIIVRRRENFAVLHDALGGINQLEISPDNSAVPMVYPLLVQNGSELKRILTDKKVFVATYWSSIKEAAAAESFEYFLADNLVSLPVDQRYSTGDMRRITDIIKKKE